MVPEERKIRISNSGMAQLTKEQKKDAVLDFCTREGSATDVAKKFDISSVTLYKWKKQLLGEEELKTMNKSRKQTLSDDRDALLMEVEALKKQIYRQQMEFDVLNEAAEIIKKDLGINPQKLTNREKARLIDALRVKYPLNELPLLTGMPKSSYFYQEEAQRRPDKYATLRADVKTIFTQNQSRYGYRRVHAEFKGKGVTVSEKVIRRILRQEQLIVPFKKNENTTHTWEKSALQ